MTREFTLFILMLFLLSSLVALGREDKEEITGKVRMVGSSPLSQLVITDVNDNDYIIPRESYGVFLELQGKTVKLVSRVERKELVTADGKYRSVLLTLKNPELLEILD